MSSPKRNFFGIVITTIACVGLMLAMVITGCGGSNNPSGPATSTTITPLTPTSGNAVSIKGRVVSSSNAPLGGVTVSLWYSNNGIITDTGASSISTTSGEFIFSGLASGVYIIKAASNSQYLDSSKLADASSADADVGDLLILPQVTTSTIPTMDISGTIVAALTNVPLSAAQVYVDTGFATVTDISGKFSLPYVQTGIRTIKVEKPGFGSTTITLEVKGEVAGANPPTSQEVMYLGQTFMPIAPATRSVDLGTKIALFQIHENGILAGTVQKTFYSSDGTKRLLKEPYGNYTFDLWVILPDKSTSTWGEVTTNADGTWQKVAPPYADNSFEWAAIVSGSVSDTSQDGSGSNVTTWSNTNIQNPMLTRGWRVISGKTTIMDFEVRDATINTDPTSVATNLAVKVSGAVVSDLSITDNIDLEWNGPTGASSAQLLFTRLFSSTVADSSTNVLVTVNGLATDLNTYKLIPSTLGLGWGPYQFSVGVLNNTTQKYDYSNATSFNLRPGTDSLYPANNARIEVSSVASTSVHFRFPYDANAKNIFVELKDAADNILQPTEADDSTGGTITYNWGTGLPADGDYKWKVHYYYENGQVVKSEEQTIKFFSNTLLKTAVAKNLAVKVGGAVVADLSLTDDIDLEWNGPTGANSAQLLFTRLFSSTVADSSANVLVSVNGLSTDLNTYKLIPSTLGLGWGPYQFTVGVLNNITQKYDYSKATSFNLRPGTDSLFPANNSTIEISGVASNSVHFRFPYDANAKNIFIELKDTAGNIIQPTEADDSTGGTITYTWEAGSPANGDYKWRVHYYYENGQVVQSEEQTIKFFSNTPVSTLVAATGLKTSVGVTATDKITLTDDLTFEWTGPKNISEVMLVFTRIYEVDGSVKSVAVPIASVSVAAVNQHTMIPANNGLDWGPYNWSIAAKDAATQKYVNSESKNVYFRPSNEALYPSNGQVVNLTATSTVKFSFPYDDDADHIFVEIKASDGTLFATTVNDAADSFKGTISLPDGPWIADTYTWTVLYYYPDGYIMKSVGQTLTLQ